MAKLRQYNLTTLIRGVEVLLTCATNSKKSFAQIIDKPVGYVNDYAAQGADIEECLANPGKIYAQAGLSGEAMHIFERNRLYELEEIKAIINEHREKYPTPRSWHESKSI